MNEAFTAKNWPVGKAPDRLVLTGDKTRKAEPAQHIIEFPGGAIELTRTTTGDYWAHIIVHRGQALEDGSLRTSGRGVVVGSRVDGPRGVCRLGDGPEAELTQVALLIRPER